jgi:hypothetical protein
MFAAFVEGFILLLCLGAGYGFFRLIKWGLDKFSTTRPEDLMETAEQLRLKAEQESLEEESRLIKARGNFVKLRDLAGRRP